MHMRLPGLLAHIGAPPPAVLGLYMQLFSSACVTVMSLVAKVAGSIGLPVFEIVLARSLVLLIMSAAMLARRGAAAEWPWRSERRLLLLVRGMLGFGAVSCLYWAVQYLPLGDTAVLTFLAPVFVAAAAPLVLGERAGKGVALAMPLCVAGVVLVAQPEFLFGAGVQALSAVGVTIGIGQAVFSAAAKLCIRSLGSTEPVASIIFAMAGVSTLGSTLFCALLPGQFVVPHSAAAWGLLLAAGLLGCGVQLLATTALKLSKVAATISMSYSAVVWGVLLDLVVYHKAPSLLSLLGAALVCASSFLIVRYEARSKEALSPVELKAKDSARLEVAADAYWQRLEAGAGGSAAGTAAADGSSLPPEIVAAGIGAAGNLLADGAKGLAKAARNRFGGGGSGGGGGGGGEENRGQREELLVALQQIAVLERQAAARTELVQHLSMLLCFALAQQQSAQDDAARARNEAARERAASDQLRQELSAALGREAVRRRKRRRMRRGDAAVPELPSN
ncbi:multidrug transporter isoform A [Chlorella sorokiniana]|uniref:Multidrug transporter isoform A n=1 Tax=Chlorella sorokiniana TaxID=3076 RepID=A0A2P6TXC8_CHLSO|nr:multidrug transporter isoform B [Chlorella sorokiniana]PRW58708.1 multidrug transporter isoform A [Chlorella sorokiniana]|eukprot:PRW58707.1 multidrug transporter isoform B [Chlorella sorokiniana]